MNSILPMHFLGRGLDSRGLKPRNASYVGKTRFAAGPTVCRSAAARRDQ